MELILSFLAVLVVVAEPRRRNALALRTPEHAGRTDICHMRSITGSVCERRQRRRDKEHSTEPARPSTDPHSHDAPDHINATAQTL